MQRNLKPISITGLILLPSLILLSACSPAVPKTPTPDANAIITQAAQTVSAQLSLTPHSTATVAPTNPPLPTETSNAPVATVEQPAQPPAAANSPVPTTAPVTSQDGASFVADLTVPDGTGVAPGGQFTKSWRIKNTGKSAWTTAYSLVPIDGDHMGSPDSIPMPKEVKPGETVDISVNLTAPTKSGTYQTYFRLRNASGQYFRLDGTGDLWLKIVVGNTATETPKPGSTETPTPVTPTVTNTP